MLAREELRDVVARLRVDVRGVFVGELCALETEGGGMRLVS